MKYLNEFRNSDQLTSFPSWSLGKLTLEALLVDRENETRRS